MGRVRKWIVRVLLLLVALCLLFVALVVFVFNTESGTRWIIARVHTALPGELVVSDFAGTLWAGLHFDSFTYSDAAQILEIKQLDLVLHWPSIVAGRAGLQSVRAEVVVRTSLQPPPPRPEPFELAMQPLPVDVTVSAATVGVFSLVSAVSRQDFSAIDVKDLLITGNRFRARKVMATRDSVNATIRNFSIRLAANVATSGDLSWQLEDGSWSGQGTVSGSLLELNVQQDVVGEYPATVSGILQVLNRVEPEFDVMINWSRWVAGSTEVLDGEMRLVGIAERFNASYDATVALNEQQRYEVRGTAIGDINELSEFEANITGREGELDLVGRMLLRPEFSANAAARAKNIDPATFRSELTGNLEATADLSVDRDGALVARDFAIAGLLNNAPVRASGELRVSSEQQQCLQCILNVGENRFTVAGQSNAQGLLLSLTFNAPRLDQLWPGLAGTAVGDARIEGSIDDPRGNGTVTLKKVAWQKSEYGDFVVSWRGNPERADVNADWRYEDIAVTANGEIRRGAEQVAGVIRKATIAKEQLGSWVLQDAFAFRMSGEDMSIDSNEWIGTLGNIRISELSVLNDTLRAVATARNMPLQFGNQMLPQNFQLSGTASADIDLTRTSDLWSGVLHWEQADTVLRVTDVNNDVTEVKVSRAVADANLSNGGVVAKASIGIDPGVTGELNVTLEQLAIDAAMTGSLRLQGQDWSWISAVVPQIDRFEGAISAAISVQGPLNAPGFSGTAEWQNGRLVVPASNVLLDQISVVIAGAPGGDATITGSAKSGDGTLQLTGRLSDLMQETRSASFKITGEGAELINWPEYRVWGSPELEMSGNADAWHIKGKLDVPRANISLREVPVGAVTVSPDVVVLGEENGVVRKTRLTAETRLLLGKRVRFEALGLDTRLGGDLLFKLVDDRPLSAEGRLTLIDGSYAIYGQKLQIEQGDLTFTGPLDDPIVDVKAVRVIESFEGTVKAGIHLQGRAQNLTSTVYAEPAMADADALSYLVIGRPLNQATESEGGELSGAAIAMGLRQAARLTDQIGQTLGLDQLSLAGDGGDTTALVAGKQINSRLHARYAYGVFSRLGTLLLRYRIARSVTLEAGAGENQSIDILYSIEK